MVAGKGMGMGMGHDEMGEGERAQPSVGQAARHWAATTFGAKSFEADPVVDAMLHEAFLSAVRRWMQSAPASILFSLLAFWLVDATMTGMAFAACILLVAALHWAMLSDGPLARGPLIKPMYLSAAALVGLLPLLVMPPGFNGQIVLLIVIIVGLPMAAVGLCANRMLAARWMMTTGICSVVAWTIVDHNFASLLPQVVSLAVAILSLSIVNEGWTQQRTLVEASLSARRSSQFDALTGLYRRATFMEMVEESLQAGRNVSLFFLDINRFKVINDTLGHPAGDQLLTAVAGRLRGALRDSDFAGRMGGDEIAILVPGSSRSAALEIGERLGRLFDADFQLVSTSVPVTASIGIACSDRRVTSAADLVRHADTAMYAAKREGRKVRLFDETMHGNLVQLEETELELRASLRRGEVFTYLQPIFDTERNEVAGFEALGRWNRNGTIIAAADFFLSAEHGNLLPDVTRAVARDLVDLTMQMDSSDVPIFGVNVEAGDLGAFLDWFSEQPVDPTRWIVELTETQIVDNFADAERDVRRATEMGVGVVLDDFGKGYSSLTRILRLPLMGLKIDASFIAEMLHNATARAIVSSAIHLANECDLVTIAEGVETKAQADALSEMGVRMMQGYHFFRPASVDDTLRAISDLPLRNRPASREVDVVEPVDRTGQTIG